MTHTWLIISKTNQLSILIDFLLGLRSVIDKNISLFNKSTFEITGIRNIFNFSFKRIKIGRGDFFYRGDFSLKGGGTLFQNSFQDLYEM